MKTGSNGFTGVFHQIHKEEIAHKLLHKTQEEGTVCNLNNEARVTLIPKSHKDIT